MAESQRIEDLRKRYHEHPRRFFAPLANEYRKAGFHDRALLLCEKHLKEQPDNMNGLVVFGQTLFELGHHVEAAEPFTAALALDPENLIALRHLGDIARLGGDVETAKRWYEKVLEVDRRNDEVLDLLQELGGGAAATTEQDASPLITLGGNVSVSGGDAGDLGMIELDGPAPSEPPAPATPKAKPPAGPGRTVVLDAAALAAATAADRAAAEPAAAKPKEPPAATTVEVTPRVSPPAPAVAPSPPVASAPSAAPAPSAANRASLLDVAFDFSDMPLEESTPAAPLLGAESAESGISSPEIETAPSPTAGTESLIVDASPEGEALSTGMAEGLETTAMSEPEPGALEGLQPTEIAHEEVAPLAGLEPSSVEHVEVAPLPGLELAAEDAVTHPGPPPAVELPSIDDLAPAEQQAPTPEIPLLEGTEASPEIPYLESESPSAEIPLLDIEPSSEARPKPRMTKASMASIPLLADYGLEEDEPAKSPPADEPPISSPPAALPAAEQAEPAAASINEEARKPQKTPAFVTETMAALYLKQGYKAEAIDVYKQLIAQDPADAGLKDRLAALQRGDETGLDFEEPPADAPEPEPAPANAVLDEVSFSDVGLQTPPPAAPLELPPATGPSARDFFAMFARRGANGQSVSAAAAPVASESAPAASPPIVDETAPIVEAATVPAPAAVAASGWPLDALFGAASDVADLHAAAVIASIGTFEGPSGGTGLDELFAAGGDAAPRANVRRASETLKFDQFFSPSGNAPSEEAPPLPAAGESEPEAAPAAGGDDELDQFQGWLRGLKP